MTVKYVWCVQMCRANPSYHHTPLARLSPEDIPPEVARRRPTPGEGFICELRIQVCDLLTIEFRSWSDWKESTMKEVVFTRIFSFGIRIEAYKTGLYTYMEHFTVPIPCRSFWKEFFCSSTVTCWDICIRLCSVHCTLVYGQHEFQQLNTIGIFLIDRLAACPLSNIDP